MPYVHLITSTKMDEQSIATVRKIIGDTIAVIPGKSNEVTVIHIDPECIISQGDPANPRIFVEVRMFGPAPMGAKKNFAREICAELEKALGVPQQFISLNIIELETWGGNGNFNSFY